jgi:hypothetical protein
MIFPLRRGMKKGHGLWGESLWVTGEHGCLPDVVKTQIEHRYSLESDSASGMWRASVPKRIDVPLDLLTVHSMGLCTGLQQLQIQKH